MVAIVGRLSHLWRLGEMIIFIPGLRLRLPRAHAYAPLGLLTYLQSWLLWSHCSWQHTTPTLQKDRCEVRSYLLTYLIFRADPDSYRDLLNWAKGSPTMSIRRASLQSLRYTLQKIERHPVPMAIGIVSGSISVNDMIDVNANFKTSIIDLKEKLKIKTK